MSNHIFKSPDGKYVANTQMKTILFNRLTKSEITSDDVKELQTKYDWNSDTSKNEKEHIIERRKQLAEQSKNKICSVKFTRNTEKCFLILKTKRKGTEGVTI